MDYKRVAVLVPDEAIIRRREAREAAEKAARQATWKPGPEKKHKGRKSSSAGKEPKSI